MCEIITRLIYVVFYPTSSYACVMVETAPSGTTPPPALVRALLRVLRPLARLLLGHGVTYPYLANLLKMVFVDVAAHDFPLPEKAQTVSRLSLLTGVHRKDVKRLMHEPRAADEVPPAVSLGAELVARWNANPDYLDAAGRPRPLARFASEDGAVSFEALVAGVNKDIRPRAVLDEWLHLGVARLDDDGRVHLSTDAFVPRHGFDEKAFYFGQNVHDHLAATAHNLMQNEPPFLERSVYYDNLTPASVAKLAALSKTLGMQTLQAINREARKLARQDASAAEAKQRMNFGVYFFSEPGGEKRKSD